MSDINTKSLVTKLRGNETPKNCDKNGPTSDSSFQVDPVAYSSLQNSKLIKVSTPNQCVYRGRGMAIQQLAESMSSRDRTNDSNNRYFSNTTIERHFNNLREENAKKLMEKNENI